MLCLDGDLGLECAVIGGIDQLLSTLSAATIVILADSVRFEKFD
jgi:hypothetical protein